MNRLSESEILDRCTVRDFTGTREPYVEIAAVRLLDPRLADELEAERAALRNTDPFAGTEFAEAGR